MKREIGVMQRWSNGPQLRSALKDWIVGLATLGSPSPRPSPLGRGRMVHRLSITSVPEFAQQLLAKHPSEARCSLSLRERVRVRGKYSVADAECSISPL